MTQGDGDGRRVASRDLVQPTSGLSSDVDPTAGGGPPSEGGSGDPWRSLLALDLLRAHRHAGLLRSVTASTSWGRKRPPAEACVGDEGEPLRLAAEKGGAHDKDER